MIPGKNRGVLEANLAPILKSLSVVRDQATDVENRMAHYKILPGETRGYLNEPETLYKADMRILCLLTEAIYAKTSNVSIKPLDYFTQQEINEAHLYDENIYREQEKIDFPLTLEEAHLINKDYKAEITVQTLKLWLDNQLINYNFDSQREAVKLHRFNEVYRVPKLVQKNIDEMSELLQKGELETSEIVFNATLGTAFDGKELIYDDKKRTILVMPGTRLDIIDGYHRCQAVLKALSINPNIDYTFEVLIKNTTVFGAQKYLAQSEQRTPMSIVVTKHMKEQTTGDRIVDVLKQNYDLQNKISDMISIRNFELINSQDLKKYIENNFTLVSGKDIQNVSQFLNEFFTELVALYPKELGTNVAESKKSSYIGHELVFAGYLKLAGLMFKQNIAASQLSNVMQKLSITNNELEKVIKNNGKKKIIKDIEELFNIGKLKFEGVK